MVEARVPDRDIGFVHAAQVALARSTMQVDGRTVRLGPGMAVTVEFAMGERRLIEFLLSPLLKYGDEAGRER